MEHSPVINKIVPIEQILDICLPLIIANSPAKENRHQYKVPEIGTTSSKSIPEPIQTIGTTISDMLIKPAIIVNDLRHFIPAIIKKMPTMNSHNIKVKAKIIQINIPNISVLPPICGFRKKLYIESITYRHEYPEDNP